MYPDPIRGGDDVLVLCSVYNPDDTPHATNTRALLEKLLTPAMHAEKPLYGFEQARRPLCIITYALHPAPCMRAVAG